MCRCSGRRRRSSWISLENNGGPRSGSTYLAVDRLSKSEPKAATRSQNGCALGGGTLMKRIGSSNGRRDS